MFRWIFGARYEARCSSDMVQSSLLSFINPKTLWTLRFQIYKNPEAFALARYREILAHRCICIFVLFGWASSVNGNRRKILSSIEALEASRKSGEFFAQKTCIFHSGYLN
jgi:hypothetical protein